MTEAIARTGVARLAWAVALLAFGLVVVAGAGMRGETTGACAGWGDCSGWTHLSTGGAIGRLHLLVAAATALTTIALVGVAWSRLRDDRRVVRAAALALALVGVQTGAVLAPGDGDAAVWGAAAHLGATALLLALAIWLATGQAGSARIALAPADARVAIIAHWAAIAVFGVLVSGAWLTASENATTCDGWPLCHAEGSALSAGTLLTADAHGLHRALVLVSGGLLVLLATLALRAGGRSRLRLALLGGLLAVFVAEALVGAVSATSGGDERLVSTTHYAAAGVSWALLATVLVAAAGAAPGTASRLMARDYLRVMKPGIIVLLLITTVGAMLIAGPWPSLGLVLATMLGGALASGGASALNCYYDRDIDVVMARTRNRPLPTGRLTPAQVRNFGLALSALAVVELTLLVNPVAAALALGGNLFYVLIYTRWLKRATPQNIVIGGAAGAFPPLVGWAAVTGTVSLTALLLFAVIFYWTPPHFWSLALLKARDYERAGVPMLPVTHGEQHTRRQILLYALLLVGVTLLLVPAGAGGWLYLASAVVLGAVFVGYAARMYVEATSRLAWRLFKFSNYYLTLILAALVLDRLV